MTTTKDENAIKSRQFLGLATDKEKIQEIIFFCNRLCGFQIESTHVFKFIFKNINAKDPNEEYSFTVQLAHETYTLMNCDPHLDGTKELIQELNQTDDVLKFVGIMREKFQAAAANGSYTVSASAPASSVPVGEGQRDNENAFQVQAEEVDKIPEKVNHGRKRRSPASGSPNSVPLTPIRPCMKLSCTEVPPGSAGSDFSVRRSARLKDITGWTDSKGSTGGDSSMPVPAAKNDLSLKKCMECKTDHPRFWRKGPDGKMSLCNACGTRYKRREMKKLVVPGGGSSMPGPAAKNDRSVKKCMECKTDHSRFWRKGPDGEPLCNACGKRYKRREMKKLVVPGGDPSVPVPAAKNDLSLKKCMECKTEHTGLWRKGPDGKMSLCNACGQRYKKRKMEKLVST
ncbi:hypothetical protein AQUCO_00800096v1 [Aquilegia coerulea]|uniref:Kinetochore protein SPC25 n=1 Tax=Aquilegia coerulea TaxID=218851 RepID=A0A2G5EH91_AQUCA|nr:hypothetical protein AQUCO_00800096v1 [Aquilegia coerulea]